tara:strand:+ start:256 stop:504 length:249 start_codon:yes stop_codon:yes gene_type:complete
MADDKRPEESEGIEIPDIEQVKIVNLGSDMRDAIMMNFLDFTNFDGYVKEVDDIEDLKSNTLLLYNNFLWAEALFEKLLREE